MIACSHVQIVEPVKFHAYRPQAVHSLRRFSQLLLFCQNHQGCCLLQYASVLRSNHCYFSQGIEELNVRLRRLEELLTKNTNLLSSSSNASPGRTLLIQMFWFKVWANRSLVTSRQETSAEDLQITNTVSWLESDAFEHRTAHDTTKYVILPLCI